MIAEKRGEDHASPRCSSILRNYFVEFAELVRRATAVVGLGGAIHRDVAGEVSIEAELGNLDVEFERIENALHSFLLQAVGSYRVYRGKEEKFGKDKVKKSISQV